MVHIICCKPCYIGNRILQIKIYYEQHCYIHFKMNFLRQDAKLGWKRVEIGFDHTNHGRYMSIQNHANDGQQDLWVSSMSETSSERKESWARERQCSYAARLWCVGLHLWSFTRLKTNIIPGVSNNMILFRTHAWLRWW